MTEPSQEVSKRKIFDIDTAAKLIAFFTILFYVIGFITTNLYLQQLGFSDFSLLKPRFILTGALVVFSIIYDCLFLVYGYVIFIDNLVKFIRLTLALFYWLVSWLVWLVCFLILYKNNIDGIGLSQLISNSFKLYFSGSIVGLISLSPWILTYTRKKVSLNIKDDYLLYFSITIILIYIWACILYLGIFTQLIYPKIPEQFGGGEPRQVRILFAKDQADSIKQNGIPTCSSGKLSSNWSKPVSLLFEGSENYLLRLDDTRPPIQLKKTTFISLELISERYNQKQKLGDCPSYLTSEKTH